jgi:phosphate transport system permease protein
MADGALTARVETGADLLFDRSARTRWRLGFDRAVGWLLPLLFLVAIVPILDLVYYISSQALPTLTWKTLTTTSAVRNPYVLGLSIYSTAEVMVLATSLAVLLGLFGGVATAEFLSERVAGWVRMSANLLVGTPSVILGYMGYFLFCLYFGWGLSFIAGVFTLAFFMTPYIYRIADLAYSSIPRPIREAAFGSGARPYQYVLKVGAPIAFPQILNGIFLALAIGTGETAPIFLTTTQGVIPPTNLFSPVTFLPATIWENFSQPAGSPAIALAFQAALILLIVVVGLNIVVRIISSRYQKRLEGLYQ